MTIKSSGPKKRLCEFTAYVKKAFDARADADYDLEGFDFEDDDDIEPYVAHMKTFISTIKAWIEANPA